MAVCPNCQATTEEPYLLCPKGDGFHTIDEESYRANAGDSLLGRAIDGRYIVDGLLGQGSMARVYRAYQTKVDRSVALKVFFAEKIANSMLPHRDPTDVVDMARTRFTQEAKVLGKLAHPNCVTVYDFGIAESGEVLYIAMEFVAGISLRKGINRGLKYDAILEIAQQVLLGLREAHGVGIVHQDLKPENIILSFRFASEEQVVKVVDFGIASLLGQDLAPAKEGALFGTPAYMSPEQCRSDHKAIGPHTDIYSLGCILYEMASGNLPFVTKSPVEMVRMHMDSPVPLLTMRPGLNAPPAFANFVMKCMSKKPEDRFADAQSALLALNALMDGAASITDGSGLISTADLMRRRASAGSQNLLRGSRVSVPQNQISGDDIPPPIVESQEIERPNLLAQDLSQELPSIIAATDTVPPGFGGAVRNVDQLQGNVNSTMPRPEERRDTPFLERNVGGLPMPIVIAIAFVLLAVLATFGVIFSSL